MLANLSNLVAVLVALSVAAERLVEIIKNLLPFLRTEQEQAGAEGRRKAVLQLLAVAAGLLTAYLADAGGLLPTDLLRGRGSWILLGLLASGGSGFWTSIQGYVTNIKELKKTQAIDAKVQTAATVAAIANGAVALPVAAHAMLPPPVGGPLPGAVQAHNNLVKAIALANARL